MSEAPKLTYFRGRGRGELSRLIFAVNDVEIQEDYLTSKAQFQDLKATGKLMFQQVPLIEMDGVCLVESGAQANYLGLKYNMLGGTDNEKARVQVLFAGARSFGSTSNPSWPFQPPEKKDGLVQSAVSSAKNRYLPAFEKALADNETGFLVGNSPTIADCALYDVLSYFIDMPEYGDTLEGSPKCKAFLTKFAEIPGVKKYLNSPRRFPPPDSAYVTQVRSVLQF